MPEIKANGVDFHYELTGPADAPVIAFAHAIGTSLELWDAQIGACAGRFRCLRYDARGHGRSATVPGPATADDLADDLAALLDALGIARAHVAGLSLGGMTGMAFALRHPDRLGRLILMATTTRMAAPPDWIERAARVRREGLGYLADITMAPRWFTDRFAAAHPERVAPFRERFLATDREGYAASCEAIASLDLDRRIGAIAAPTLIMVGADDPATPPSMSEAIRSKIAGSELVVLPDAAHLITVEQPDRVNAHLLAFLDRDFAGRRSAGAVSFEDGLVTRRGVLGDSHVDRSLAGAGDFGRPWQDFITRVAWGEIWGDPTLAWKTRSMLTLAMMITLHREEEFKLHLGPALRNGVTPEELRALVLQTAIYAGVPAANAAFRWMRESLEGKPS